MKAVITVQKHIWSTLARIVVEALVMEQLDRECAATIILLQRKNISLLSIKGLRIYFYTDVVVVPNDSNLKEIFYLKPIYI